MPVGEIGMRAILHVDMDAFYASVEQHDRPELKGRPLLVGGTGPRGVVAAASYEARLYGVRSAMPTVEARRRCPEAICLAPRMGRYREVSAAIFALLEEVTPLVEGLSLDEAFLDVTRSRAAGDAATIAAALKRRIVAATGLTASIGVGPNKLIAKIASDLRKPDGLVIVPAGQVREFLAPLPIERISGIGPRTAERLREVGIATCGQLCEAPNRLLEPIFGRHAQRVRERAAGIDRRPVEPEGTVVSLSAEETFDHDLTDPTQLQTELLKLSERTAARLRARGLLAGSIMLKIRRADFRTYTRQRSLSPPLDQTRPLYDSASALLAQWRREQPGAAVRLLGVAAGSLVDKSQLELFSSGQSGSLDAAIDDVRARFGAAALRRARTLGS